MKRPVAIPVAARDGLFDSGESGMRAKRARTVLVLCWLVAVMTAAVWWADAAAASSWGFVTRSGDRLMVDGHPFRFSGANVEWLGLIGYGPLNFQPGQTQRYPSHYEIDDALATAEEMGTSVIRAQTLGDTVGCPNCLQPTLNHFNPQAFGVMDYAIARARIYGIRLVMEFHGDSRSIPGKTSTDAVFSAWRGGASFYSDPAVISDFEDHIAHVVDHVNTITGIPYKDDPTILGWMDCNNGCSNGTAGADKWVSTIAAFVKSHDHRHLFVDNNLLYSDSTLLADPNIDVFAAGEYPHWLQEWSGDRLTGLAPVPHQIAAMATRAGKPWIMEEFGWDKTDWQTPAALQTFLTGIEADSNISGDLYWALEGHANGHGWEPLVADEHCQPGADDTSPPTAGDPTGTGCYANEDGNWWALYYPGIDTLSNTVADMAARAQLLRTHAYRMRGLQTPPHDVPPAPVITSTDAGKVVFEGAAGSPNYSVQKRSGATWATPCDRCATDADSGWTDPGTPGCYRVVGYNLDGVAGPPSTPAGTSCPKTAAAAPSTCASTRSVRYTVPIGARSVRVTVDGKRRTLRRRGRTLLLSLNGLARRTVTVRITWRQHGHRHVRTSLLHPCTTNRKPS